MLAKVLDRVVAKASDRVLAKALDWVLSSEPDSELYGSNREIDCNIYIYIEGGTSLFSRFVLKKTGEFYHLQLFLQLLL